MSFSQKNTYKKKQSNQDYNKNPKPPTTESMSEQVKPLLQKSQVTESGVKTIPKSKLAGMRISGPQNRSIRGRQDNMQGSVKMTSTVLPTGKQEPVTDIVSQCLIDTLQARQIKHLAFL